MSDINQNVNINVNANTQDAGQDISRLENNIKTLDGAVNLVGGSIEVLAGSLALTGAVTEEQAERFQTAAVGAIALADGSKRALEGFKILATETKLLSQAQALLNRILNANPIGLVVTAVAALSAAFLILRNRTKANREEVKTSNELYAEQLELLKNTERAISGGEERLKNIQATAEAYNRTLEDQLVIAREQAQADIKLAEERLRISQDASIVNEEDIERRKIQLEQAKEVLNQVIAAGIIAEENAEKQTKINNEGKKFQEEKLDFKKKEIEFEVDLRGEYTLTANTAMTLQKQQTEVTEVEAAKRKAIADAEEEYKQLVFTEGIDNIQGALAALFGENKAIASANVLIDAAQAGVGIIKNSQTTGPFAIAYQATQFALLTATTLASLRQINSAEPGSAGGTPNIPKGGGGLPTTGGTQTFGSGGRPQIGRGSSGVTAINAVVLSGEMTSAQAQDAALRNRRRFGGG